MEFGYKKGFKLFQNDDENIKKEITSFSKNTLSYFSV